MLDLNQPVGPALVLQPMLSRMVPLTEVRPHPTTGNWSTRIVDWIDENDPSMLTPKAPLPTVVIAPSSVAQPPAPPASTQHTAPLPGGGNAASTRPAAPEPPPEPAPREKQPIERLFSGLRIYPETDVILHTSDGDIRVCMKPDEAPNTVWNFLELARGGFYHGIVFHRIVPYTSNGQPFVIQAGDPTATGDGGPGYWLPIEDSKLPHDLGVISMARSDDPDSNGSQFFFCLSREGTARLDGQYCSFGYAVEGAPVIKAIAESELADVKTGRPANPPVIDDAELVPAPPRTPGNGRPDHRITVDEARAPTTRPGRVPR
jgi:cyclophilin family peptidyl-prolyl cis-trans isomerase